MKNMLGSHVGGRGWGGGPEIWLTDRQMFALRGDSMSLGMGGGGGMARYWNKYAKKARNNKCNLHCKKELAVFPSPAGMSLIKLFLGGNNLVFSRPERVWSVTSRLGTGKWLTLFYSVPPLSSLFPHHSHSPFTKRSLRVETISLCGPPTKIFSCN
jgi:hypothetical protein